MDAGVLVDALLVVSVIVLFVHDVKLTKAVQRLHREMERGE